ncbi:MFS transporter [Spiroplasma endosymbiont of Stenodema calcarata]|uniref:MFS transporter n=1 Tax=Spiroplasma endosymbiont of Stenodema calcarata TaxID=3139328 RepID=UPI003CCB306B
METIKQEALTKKQKFVNFFTHGLNKKTIGIITILALADLFVFSGVLYLRYIMPNFHNYLQLSQSEFDIAISVYGFTALISRIPGGYLADKFNAKIMFVIALIMTGTVGIWWTTLTKLNMDKTMRLTQLYIIYFLWGISIAGLFWNPLWKLVSQNVPKEKQGAAYGLQGSILGLFGVIVVAGAATGVTQVTKNLTDSNSDLKTLPFLIFAYCICGMVLLMAILSLLFIPNKKRVEKETIKFSKHFLNLLRPFKFLRVWLCGIFVFGMYMFQSVFSYYMKDALTVIGVNVTIVAVLGGIRSYGLRFLVANPIGRLSDQWKSYVLGLVFILLVGMLACLLFTLIPGWGAAWFNNQSQTIKVLFHIIMCVLFIVIGCIGWALLTLRFVQIGELPMEKNSYANTLAVISFLAFTPDAWFNYVAGAIGKSFTDQETKGYNLEGIQILLMIAIGCVLIGLICGIIVYCLNKKEIKKLNKTSFRWRELGNV